MTVLKKHFQYLFFLTVLATIFSCSDDEDNTPEWNNISGSYSGWTKGEFSYSSTGIVTEDETVVIKVNTDGTVDLSLTSNTWGETTVTGATVASGSSSFTISGTSVTKMGHSGTEAKEYEGTVSGTVSKDKSSMTLTVSCPSVMGGTTITFTNGSAPISELLVGTYSGYTKAVFTYSPSGIYTDDESVTITANDDGTVNVSYTSETWGTATIESIVVTKDNDNYVLAETEGKIVMTGMSGTSSEYACLASGTVSTDKDTYDIVFSVPSVMGGTTITFANGSAPTE